MCEDVAPCFTRSAAPEFYSHGALSTVIAGEKMICRILLLIILTSCVSGSFVVNVTQTSYQAEENHNITLEWTFTTKPDNSTNSVSIICQQMTNYETSGFYHVSSGVEVSESQDAKFSGRVQSDKDALREGRIRLLLSRLRTDDSAAAVRSKPQGSTLSPSAHTWMQRTVLYTALGFELAALLGFAVLLVNRFCALRCRTRLRRYQNFI
ncbi:uncharacterized protein LOC120725857 isoform X2 [Simochromis diagramma]|uniref:uncharacterized protein LOC120725857 isoform X2 n=1 Tax=Simochromis diagramma TaxID=43689 RepID=UPI001A7E340A|nr:uncharacterized protein LOC120725857 isoform X2 [Simochromis diagramma]